MSLAIVGSREFVDYNLFCKVVDEYIKEKNITKIVSGGCRGADALAEKYAKEKNIPTQIFKPEWNKYGKSAGMIRNQDIINEADYVVAFPSKNGSGTQNSILLAKKKGIDCLVKYID